MNRLKFIKNCCYTALGVPLASTVLQSCESIYYASSSKKANKLIIAKSEFWKEKNGKKSNRSFVLVKPETSNFPICIQKIDNESYVASLMRCTHRNCELNVGGGIYSCPCHGSEFSITGKVLEGPAEENLKNYIIELDENNLYVILS